MARSDRFLKACRKEAVDCTPVWLLSQSGRYLDEYRQLREQYSLMDLITSPELAAQATLIPVEQFELDAAIIFSDILPVLEVMGMQLDLSGPNGPSVVNPIRCHADIESLVIPDPEQALNFTLQAIQIAVHQLQGRVPLIGFAGAPFSLACYAVEGHASSRFARVKSLMHGDTQWWHKLMDKLTSHVVEYLTTQVEAGVKAIQLFDSFVGVLSPYDFREYVLPHLQRMLKKCKDRHPDVPVIYYGTDTAGFLSLIGESGCDVVSVDWKVDLPDAWKQIGYDTAIQGNLDPALLLAPTDEMHRQVARILDAVNGRVGHIMNLGHSVVSTTTPESVEAFVNYVHRYTSES